ncbi:MAG: hypothetical protein GF401_08260 [Chitinivibrionales bacterium]|nr:hypothetical protein [Chitinivibrionales bacterium]
MVIFSRCAFRDGDEIGRSNPYDPHGDNWTINSVPRANADLENNPLWADFNFDDSTGTVEATLYILDANEDADTISIQAYAGTELADMRPVMGVRDSVVSFDSLQPATKYYYRITITDSWDSSTVIAGSFITPEGIPPHPPRYFDINSYTNYIQAQFTCNNGQAVCLYRSAYPYGPYRKIWEEDYLPCPTYSSYYSYYDTVSDYKMYYYQIAAYNQYGAARVNDTLTGKRRSTAVSRPSSINVSYLDSTRISVEWYAYSTGYSFEVYRSDKKDGLYVLVGTTQGDSYIDTVDRALTWYYKIAAVNKSGVSSNFSPIAYPALPARPSSFNATDGTYSSYVYLGWYSVSGAREYKIYRAQSESGLMDAPVLAVTQTTTYKDSVSSGDTYYYQVSAVDNMGREGDRSYHDDGYLKRLSRPSYFSATKGTYSTHIRLTWYQVSGAVGYIIFRAESSSELDTIAPFDTIATSSYNDTVLTTDTWYYEVAAFDSLGRIGGRSYSEYGFARRLSAPNYFSASNGTYSSHIHLSWRSVSHAKGYYLYRAESSERLDTITPFDTVFSLGYNDTVPTADHYYYNVAAFDTLGRAGSRSSSNSGYRKGLSAPDDVIASRNTYDDYIRVSWRLVSGAEKYYLYRADSVNVDYYLIDSTTQLFYNDSVPKKINYYYRVAAVTPDGLAGSKSNYTLGYLKRLKVPSSFLASNGTYHYIQLTWVGVSAANGYIIYRSDSSSASNFQVIDSTESTVYNDVNVEPGIPYYYRIAAYDTTGRVSSQTDYRSGASKSFSAPVNIDASNQKYYDSIVVTWDSVPGAAGYHVYRLANGEVEYSKVATVSVPKYVDTAISSTNSYYYKISSVHESGTETARSSYSLGNVINSEPDTPVEFYARAADKAICVSWRPVTSGPLPDSYYILRALTNSVGAFTIIDSTTDTVYYDTVGNSETYYYRIQACNRFGESGLTVVKSAHLTGPEPPANIKANYTLSPHHTKITWSARSGVFRYYIYRCEGTSLNLCTKIDSTADTVYYDSSGADSITYCYRIVSVNDVGAGTLSSCVNGTRLPPPPSIVTSSTFSHVRILWGAAGSVEGYKIYRSLFSDALFTLLDSVRDMVYIDTVPTGDMYYYKISSYTSEGESRLSSPAVYGRRLRPEAPDQVFASRGEYIDTVLVYWSESSGADSYKLFRSGDSNFSNPVLRGTVNDTFYYDTTGNDSVYYYKVKAVNGAGESVLNSTPAIGSRKPEQVPGMPDSLTASSDNPDFIELTWKVAGTETFVEGYRLYRGNSVAGPFSLIVETDSPFYQDPVPLSYPDGIYWYMVKAYNEIGEGPGSDPAQGYRNSP